MPQVVTIFQNIRETETPFFKDVTYILQRIKEGKNQELVKKIRQEKNKTKRNDLKKNLPAICFSGQFNKRSCLLYTSPSPRDRQKSRMPSSA